MALVTVFLVATAMRGPAGAALAAATTCLGQPATIVGGPTGDDPLVGTPGDDVIVGRSGDDVIRGAAGDDLICGNGGADTLQGGGGNDSLQGGDGDDTILSGADDDRFLGGAGTDIVDYSEAYFPSEGDGVTVNLATGRATGEGADRLSGLEGVKGSDYGSDVLTASDSGSTLDGGFGADVLNGGASADVLRAGASDADPDTLEGNGGDDTLDFGGSGFDRLIYEDAPGPVHVDLAISTVTGGDGADTLVVSPDYVLGSRYGDHILGNDDGQALVGGRGPDTIDGRGYVDAISPGRGDDTVDGGLGDDSVGYADATAGVTVDLALGTVTGGSGTDTLMGIEHVGGTSFDDVMKGDEVSNSLGGGPGNDTLRGRGGNDFLHGGDGRDRLIGGAEIDSCDSGEIVDCEYVA